MEVRQRNLQGNETTASVERSREPSGSVRSRSRSASTAKLTRKHTSHEFEFGGPVGALGITIVLPVVVYGLYFLCDEDSCFGPPRWVVPTTLPPWSQLFNATAFYVVGGWFMFLVLLEKSLPGEVVDGSVLRDGRRLKYKLNGFSSGCVAVASVLLAERCELIRLSWLYDHFAAVVTAAIIFAFAMSVALYGCSFLGERLLAEGGNSGIAIYDFFIGRELNPRIGDFDLKCFCELRPGLIGWIVLDIAFALKQHEQRESGACIPILLVTAFQALYVFDALYYERAILTTMDITTDGFGLMLVFGDLVWVPFTYSLQARYLVSRAYDPSALALAGLVALNAAGYIGFRMSNLEKDRFRRDPTHPSVRHLKTLPTARGTQLIISGWWGMSRHPNYFADLIMALSWSLACGTSDLLVYFYPIYFTILLLHRQQRDDHHCSVKYGEDWKKYCELVPYRIVPFVY